MAGKSSLKLWVVEGGPGPARPRPAPLAGESVGLFLRLQRERSGLSLEAAAARVRIRAAYIAAIEDDRFDALPGRAYASGFVRAYAELLGADVDATLAAAHTEIGRLPAPKLRARKPEVERESRLAPVMAATICLALAGYVYWYFDNTRARFENAAETLARVDAPDMIELAENGETAPQPYRPFPNARPPGAPPRAAAPAIVSLPADRPVAALAPREAEPAAPPAVDAGVAASPDRPAVDPAPLPPVAALAADLPDPRLTQPAAKPDWSIPAPGPAMAATHSGAFTPPSRAAALAGPLAAAPPAEPATSSDAPAPAPPPGAVTLRALADTWIEIKAVGADKVLFSRVLREGETLPAPDRTGLTMTVGNAGGLEITVDGAVAPSLGDHGKVVRNVSLDGSSLLAGAR